MPQAYSLARMATFAQRQLSPLCPGAVVGGLGFRLNQHRCLARATNCTHSAPRVSLLLERVPLDPDRPHARSPPLLPRRSLDWSDFRDPCSRSQSQLRVNYRNIFVRIRELPVERHPVPDFLLAD